MKDNRLYHFLHRHSSFVNGRIQHPFKTERIEAKKTRNFYIKVTLPKPRGLSVISVALPDGDYNLGLKTEEKQAAHTTFFQDLDPSNPTKSEYHYTANFTDKSYPGSIFKLHVYFDNKDKHTTAPKLTEYRKDGSKRTVPLGNAKDVFISLALNHSHTTMASIRSSYNEKIEQDRKLNVTMANHLDELSKKIEQNPVSYLEALGKQVHFLDEIVPYHDNQEHWVGIRKMLSHHADMLDAKAFGPKKSHANETDDRQVADLETKKDSKQESYLEEALVVHTRSIQKKPVLQALSPYVRSAEEAMLLFEKSLTLPSLSEGVGLLCTAIVATQEASLFSMEPIFEKSSADLLALHHLLVRQQQYKEDLLFQLLTKNHMDEARLLLGNTLDKDCVINSYRDSQLIDFALKMGRPDVLAFMLENSDFPINTFTMQGQDGPLTAAMYCFLHADKVQCLSVLIKHGVSLMQPCPNTGLPLAHSILSPHPVHSCILALEENSSATFLNPSFYYQLISVLRAATPTTEIIQSIAEYETRASQLSTHVDMPAITQQQYQNVDAELLAAINNPEVAKNPNYPRLVDDPEIRIKLAEWTLYAAPISGKKMTAKQQRMGFQEALNLIAAQQDPTILEMSFKELKEKILEDIQYEIAVRSKMGSSKKDTKARQGIVEREKSKKEKRQQISKEKERKAVAYTQAIATLDEAIEQLNSTRKMLALLKQNLNRDILEFAELPETMAETMAESKKAEYNKLKLKITSFSDVLRQLPSPAIAQGRAKYPERDRDDYDGMPKPGF